MSPDILWFQKIVLHNKIINKTQRTKNRENSVHHFEKQMLCKTLLHR